MSHLAKATLGNACYLFKPAHALLVCTPCHRPQHMPLIGFNATIRQHTSAPNELQRVAKCGLLALRVRVRGVEDQGAVDGEKPLRQTIGRGKSIGDTWNKDAIKPSSQDGRRFPPPVWMDNKKSID